MTGNTEPVDILFTTRSVRDDVHQCVAVIGSVVTDAWANRHSLAYFIKTLPPFLLGINYLSI